MVFAVHVPVLILPSAVTWVREFSTEIVLPVVMEIPVPGLNPDELILLSTYCLVAASEGLIGAPRLDNLALLLLM